jgi:hypothetical protein
MPFNLPPSDVMVQIIVAKQVSDIDAIRFLHENLNDIPFIFILFKAVEDTKDDINANSIDTIVKLMKTRHGLITEWVKNKEHRSAKHQEFATRWDNVFNGIRTQINNGSVSGMTYQWHQNIQQEVSKINSVSSRFLKMQTLVGDTPNQPNQPNQLKEKRHKSITSFTFGNVDDISNIPSMVPIEMPDPTTDDPDPTSNLEQQLNMLDDPLTDFMRIAVGTYGSTMSKAFNQKPIVFANYTSSAKLKNYFRATRPWVFTAVQRVVSDASRFCQSVHSGDWKLLAVLCHPESQMFFHAARLCGLFMREEELQQVSRVNRTLNDMTEHLRNKNDTSLLLIYEIKRHPEQCLYFAEI